MSSGQTRSGRSPPFGHLHPRPLRFAQVESRHVSQFCPSPQELWVNEPRFCFCADTDAGAGAGRCWEVGFYLSACPFFIYLFSLGILRGNWIGPRPAYYYYYYYSYYHDTKSSEHTYLPTLLPFPPEKGT